MNIKMQKVFSLVILFVVLIQFWVLPQSAIPFQLAYQGIATDLLGNPKPNGIYTIKFALYDDKANGNLLWIESKSVSVQNGIVSTHLGDSVAINLPFDKVYWLGMRIGTDPELLPRVRLSSTPYSVHADKADSAYLSLHSLISDSSFVCGKAFMSTTAQRSLKADTATASLRSISADTAKIALAIQGNYISNSSIDSTKIKSGGISAKNLSNRIIDSAKIMINALNRSNVSLTFKAPYADTADFVRPMDGNNLINNSIDGSKIKSATNLSIATLSTSGNVIVNGNMTVDGSYSFKAMVFQAHLKANWNHPSGWHLVPFDSLSFNTIPGVFDKSTNKFTPSTAGFYSISVLGYSSGYDQAGVGERYAFGVHKNGVLDILSGGCYPKVDSPMNTLTTILYLNGSTDNVQIWGFSAIPAIWGGLPGGGHLLRWNMVYLGK